MRWAEMNAFSPLFRSHEGNQPGRDVQFSDDEELLEQMRKACLWHTNLKFYLKQCEQELVRQGTPVMRPLFYHYEEEEAFLEMREYLLGRDILVAPVYQEGATSRSCYLPEDTWVHLFSGATYQGGKVVVDAPVGEPPVFIRKNSNFFEELMSIKE